MAGVCGQRLEGAAQPRAQGPGAMQLLFAWCMMHASAACSPAQAHARTQLWAACRRGSGSATPQHPQSTCWTIDGQAVGAFIVGIHARETHDQPGLHAHLMRRSPKLEVYSSAHCTYALLVETTLSSCWIWTANALSGSTWTPAAASAWLMQSSGHCQSIRQPLPRSTPGTWAATLAAFPGHATS